MLELAVRVVVSLFVVLGLFWACARVGSRRLGGPERALLRVRGRQALSRGASMAVVEVGGRVLVVGVSDSGVRLLTELDPDQLPEAPAPALLPAPVRRRRTASSSAAAASVVPGSQPVLGIDDVAALSADPASRFVPYFPQVVDRAEAVTVREPVDELVEVEDVTDAEDVDQPDEHADDRDELPEDWGLDIFSAPLARPGSHRVPVTTAARATSVPVADGALAGSVLDAGTWKQAWAAATRRHPVKVDGETA